MAILDKFDLDIHSVIYIIEGARITFGYTAVAVCLGLLLGVLLLLSRMSTIKPLNYFALVYLSIFRGTPLLVQLSIIYFAPPTFGWQISVFEAAILTLSLNSSAYITEILRSSIKGIDKGQFESCTALSIPYTLMMKDIILPQALRSALPSLVNEMLNLLKETAIISIIGGADIMKRAQEVSAEKYSYFEPYIIAALCYYIMVLMLSSLAKYTEIKCASYDHNKKLI